VYRHLLYNRGTEPRRAPGRTGGNAMVEAEKVLQDESADVVEISDFVDKREHVRMSCDSTRRVN